MSQLPSHHQINDRVSLKFGEGYVGAQVVGVFFTEAKVLYTVVTDQDIQLENVDSAVVCDPASGETD
jgi:hypothetical protein